VTERPEPLEDMEEADRATVEGGTARSGAVRGKDEKPSVVPDDDLDTLLK
jgi:hypothetical protein